MSDAMANDNPVLARWRTLHPADREAILHALPAEQREIFEQMLAEEANDAAGKRKSEFRSYSAWAARLLSDCTAQDGAGHTRLPVTPLVASTLIEIHGELRDRPGSSRRGSGLADRIRPLLQAWGLAV